jgi:dTDP-4-amino-4,6-dideoxygalactose transaminase
LKTPAMRWARNIRGKRVGSIADMTVFSFHPVKHLTTGEGGMVTTNDARLAETLRRFRNHGISSEARSGRNRGSGFTRWCCWASITG